MKHVDSRAGFSIVEMMILVIVLAIFGMVGVEAIRKSRAHAQAVARTEAATGIEEKAGLSRYMLQELTDRLKSGDPAQVALALQLPVSEVDKELVSNFAATTMVFDLETAEIYGGGWRIEADIVDPQGKTTRWEVILIDADTGLVFVDSSAL